MSSFNYFSPPSAKCQSISISSPLPYQSISSPSSTLNPDAFSYIPEQDLSLTASLNAGAAPYIPLPPTLITKPHNPKPIPPIKKTHPSFSYYSQLKSAQIYNAISKYLENTKHSENSTENTHDNSDIDSDTSSMIDTPIPASVASSVFSDANNIDLINIEPYIPNQNMTDIDQINNIIHKTDTIDFEMDYTDCDVHPVIAALTADESKELLSAPIWTPNSGHSSDWTDDSVCYSKIAIDEQDYQYILHPNKAPVKYGYENSVINAHRVAQEENMTTMTAIYPTHMQYMCTTQPEIEVGETYDKYAINASTDTNESTERNMTVQSETIERREMTEKTAQTNTNTNVTKSTQMSHKICTDRMSEMEYDTSSVATVSNNNLYSNKVSRMAVEGHCDHNYAQRIDTSHLMRIAYDSMSYTPYYGESRIAQPHIKQISYIYCKT